MTTSITNGPRTTVTLSATSTRVIATALVVAQVCAGITVAAQPTTTRGGPLPAPQVRVNRTVPRVPPPKQVPQFSAAPTEEEIFRARVFVEPLVAVGGVPSPVENAALAQAITSYRTGNRFDEIGLFRAFLEQFRNSPWRPSLEANLAQVLWARGEFSSALAHWDDAWQIAKEVDTPEGRAVAAIAITGALDVLATLGKGDQLEARLAVLEERPVSGTAAARVRRARQTLTQLRDKPDHVIPSGSQAVELLRAISERREPAIVRPRAGGAAGETLGVLEEVAKSAGLDLVAVSRPFGQPLPVPSIVHLSLGHYSAVVEHREGRYLMQDPALGGQRWVSQAALDQETSGFVLVPRGRIAPHWRRLSSMELSETVGHSCPPGGPGNNEPCPGTGVSGGNGGGGGGAAGSAPAGCGGPGCKMPIFEIKPENAGLAILDTPVGYVPPHGPPVPFTLTYDHRQGLQPQLFTYTHLGPQWTLNWISYAQEVPFWHNSSWNNETIPAHVWVYLRGGGKEIFHTPDGAGTYPAHWRSRAQLVRVSADPIRYERRRPDGSLEVYALADTAPVGQRRVFLTAVHDPRGGVVSLTYDAQFRIVAVTDALGQVSTLKYESPVDPLRLTSIEDPFGRMATFSFNPAGQLEGITDVGGLRSSFAYTTGDFIASMTTPYGTTTFTHEGADPVNHPYTQATDPLGGVRRVEYHLSTQLVPNTVPVAELPAGFSAWNDRLNYYVTLAWDARAWAAGPGSPATATVIRWFQNGWQGSFSQLQTTRVPQYVHRPGTARVWYAYQASPVRRTRWPPAGRPRPRSPPACSRMARRSNGSQMSMRKDQ